MGFCSKQEVQGCGGHRQLSTSMFPSVLSATDSAPGLAAGVAMRPFSHLAEVEAYRVGFLGLHYFLIKKDMRFPSLFGNVVSGDAAIIQGA